MANFFPLVANYSADFANCGYVGNRIEELRPNDRLDLYLSGIVNLDVSNIGILGGLPGQVLTTYGNGVQYWANSTGGGNVSSVSVPIIEFPGPGANLTPGNNQSFVNENLAYYTGANFAAVYVNGVLQRADQYTLSGNTITINQFLDTDDVVAIGPVGGTSGITIPSIQFPVTGNLFPGNSQTFTDGRISFYPSNQYAAVYVNGVLQRVTDYTISGNVLTLNQFLDVDDVVTIGPTLGGGDGVTLIETTQIDPSSIGFTLTGGPISTFGTITLNVPPASAFISALGLTGYPSLNGNANTYLNGTGTWTPVIPSAVGNIGEVQYNAGGNVVAGSANLTFNGTNLSTVNVFERTSPTTGGIINLAAGAYITAALTTNTVFTVTNVPAYPQVGSFIMHISNAANFTPTFNFGTPAGNIKWVDGIAPVLSSTTLTNDILGFYTLDGGQSWFGYVLGQDVA